MRLLTVSPDAWRSSLYASRHHFKLPEVGPPVFAQDFWDAYCGVAQSAGRPGFKGTYLYEVQSFSVIPGCERYAELDEATRLALMESVLGSIGKWEGEWERLRVRKTEGSGDVIVLKSPLAHWLRIHHWLGIQQGDECYWFKPAQRWHVPAAALAGRAWQFAHLKPLPGNLADQLDADTELSDGMRRLGMPKFDPELHSSSTRLLTDLANAAKGDEIPDQSRHRYISNVSGGGSCWRPQCSSRLARDQKLITPVRRPRRRDPHRPRHGLNEVLPAQQTHHYLTLAPGREPTPRPRPAATPVATDSSTCFLISTLLLRELSRNQVSKKTLGRRKTPYRFSFGGR